MAKKDTLRALIEKGIPEDLANRISDKLTLGALKKTSPDVLLKNGFSKKEVSEIFEILGINSTKKDSGKKTVIKEFTTAIKGIGPSKAEALYDAGFRSLEQLKNTPTEVIAVAGGIGKKYAESISKQLSPSKGEVIQEFIKIRGVGQKKAEALWDAGFHKMMDLKSKSDEQIKKVEGLENLIEDIREYVDEKGMPDSLPLQELPPSPELIHEPKKNAELRKKVEEYSRQEGSRIKNDLKNKIKVIDGINLIAQKISTDSAGVVKDLAFQMKNEIDNLVLVLGAEIKNKAHLSVMISDNLVKERNLHAGNMVKELAKEIRGGGGGQPFFATAGGSDPSGLVKALEKVVTMVKQS